MWEECRKTGWDSQWEVFLWVTMCGRNINLQGLLVHQSLAERNVSAALEKENVCEGKRREMSVHCLASYYTAQAPICIPLQLMLSRMIVVGMLVVTMMVMMVVMMVVMVMMVTRIMVAAIKIWCPLFGCQRCQRGFDLFLTAMLHRRLLCVLCIFSPWGLSRENAHLLVGI